jgi:hypothetical protein
MKVVPMYPDPYKLKIHLEHTDIYRIVLVPSDINMLQLHLVCQQAMGWMMAHLFQFSDHKVNQTIRAGLPEFEDDFGFGSSVKEEKADKVRLADFHNITNGKPFWYWYDFGDDWWHKISFQKPTKKDLELFNGEPICVKGEKACPPEDIGGVGGYFHFLEVMEDKGNPEREEFMEWFGIEEGDEFDEEYFDFDETNEFLNEIYQSEFWNQTVDEFME